METAAPLVASPVEKASPRKRLLTRHEFMDELRGYSAAMKNPGFSPMEEVLSGWSDEEIIAALEESIKDPARHGVPGDEENVTLFLLQEWMKRDLDSSTRWLTGLDSTMLKGQLAFAVAQAWPPERAAEGLAFRLKNQEMFSSFLVDHGAPLLAKAMDSAMADGPAAVNSVMQLAREHGLDDFKVLPEFPPGFDFQALAAGGELKAAVEKDSGNPVILAWAKQDRDAAYQWTLENAGAGHVHAQLLGRKDGKLSGDIDWAAERYVEMGVGQREEFMKSAGNFLGPSLLEIPYFSAAIKDPALQEELRLQGVQGIFVNRMGAMPTVETLLDELGPPERRLEILENIERQSLPDGVRSAPLDEGRLRTIMGEWTTDQKRIDRIIDHLKQ
ncbi:MAG: hypothetical protein EOP85_07525 [Verrucomicrobiaceae bacterium]|nr:MAG: hypothetical protein EOP85_07525 [Verrucomicrobiaceae bacterium]